MIEFILVAWAQMLVVEPTSRAEEIVVTARRMQVWRGRAAANERGIRCETTQSTGDADLDLIACDSLRYCMAQLTDQAAAANAKGLRRAERNARLRGLNARLAACGEEQRNLRLTDLIERRAATRTGNAQD